MLKHWRKTSIGLILVIALIFIASFVIVRAQDIPEPPEPEGEMGIEALSAAVGTSFSFQGLLEQGGGSVTGTCDMGFRLYDAETAGNQVGPSLSQTIEVAEGVFSTYLDFGSRRFLGAARWLETDVRCPAGTGDFTTLSPRTLLPATPYAMGLVPGIELQGDAEVGLYGDLFKVTATSGRRAITGQANASNGQAIHGAARATSGVNYGVFAFTDSADGYGGYFINNGSGSGNGTGVYARGHGGAAPDIILGTDGTSGGVGDNATIASDPGNVWSDFVIRGQDKVQVIIGDNGLDNSESYFSITSAGNGAVFFAYPNGTVSVPVLQITGGSDLSEQFDVSSSTDDLEPEPGMVVSIDVDDPGKLVVSDVTYDRTVAGVISGAGGVDTGMLMGHDGTLADGEYPVALTGRVYVWADASYGVIQPGDLLTTSNTPGHAMKVTDHEAAQGAILGKAMTSLDAGQGLILVLVTLQ